MQQTAAQSALKPDIGMRDIASAALDHSSLVAAPAGSPSLVITGSDMGKAGREA